MNRNNKAVSSSSYIVPILLVFLISAVLYQQYRINKLEIAYDNLSKHISKFKDSYDYNNKSPDPLGSVIQKDVSSSLVDKKRGIIILCYYTIAKII